MLNVIFFKALFRSIAISSGSKEEDLANDEILAFIQHFLIWRLQHHERSGLTPAGTCFVVG